MTETKSITKTMNLSEYLALGGQLNQLDLSKTHVTYLGAFKDKKIKHIYQIIIATANILSIVFEDGTEKNFGSSWIETEVSLVLSPKHL
jgi:hypothetical protein